MRWKQWVDAAAKKDFWEPESLPEPEFGRELVERLPGELAEASASERVSEPAVAKESVVEAEPTAQACFPDGNALAAHRKELELPEPELARQAAEQFRKTSAECQRGWSAGEQEKRLLVPVLTSSCRGAAGRFADLFLELLFQYSLNSSLARPTRFEIHLDLQARQAYNS